MKSPPLRGTRNQKRGLGGGAILTNDWPPQYPKRGGDHECPKFHVETGFSFCHNLTTNQHVFTAAKQEVFVSLIVPQTERARLRSYHFDQTSQMKEVGAKIFRLQKSTTSNVLIYLHQIDDGIIKDSQYDSDTIYYWLHFWILIKEHGIYM